MAIDETDVKYILDRAKDVFVTRDECNDKTDEINKKLANDSTKLAVIEQQLNTISWVSKTTLAAVIVALVGAVLSLILK